MVPRPRVAYAYQVPDPIQQTKTLTKLIPHLTVTIKENAVEKALLAAQEIKNVKVRANPTSAILKRATTIRAFPGTGTSDIPFVLF